MLVIGAKGFAKELLEILSQNNELDDLAFYDDVNRQGPDLLYDRFPVLKSETEVIRYLSDTDRRFTIGIGNPRLRKKMYDRFTVYSPHFTGVISRYAEIGSFGVTIGAGCNILSGVKISNDVHIGMGCMVYYNSMITHDVRIGDFVEISPGVTLLGRCRIGRFSHLGSGSIVLPDVTVGSNVIIAAGAVVTKALPDNVMAAGVPAVIKKYLIPSS
jgi:sugar O-acyltransferase (sialic acid O-acetyltransferase NeuD family)